MSITSPVAFFGRGGNVTIGSTAGISVREWKMTGTADKFRTTGTADLAHTSIVGNYEYEGSFTVNVDQSTSIMPTIYPTLSGQSGTFVFGNAYHNATGTFNILKADMTNSPDVENKVEFSFVSTGVVTFST